MRYLLLLSVFTLALYDGRTEAFRKLFRNGDDDGYSKATVYQRPSRKSQLTVRQPYSDERILDFGSHHHFNYNKKTHRVVKPAIRRKTKKVSKGGKNSKRFWRFKSSRRNVRKGGAVRYRGRNQSIHRRFKKTQKQY